MKFGVRLFGAEFQERQALSPAAETARTQKRQRVRAARRDGLA